MAAGRTVKPARDLLVVGYRDERYALDARCARAPVYKTHGRPFPGSVSIVGAGVTAVLAAAGSGGTTSGVLVPQPASSEARMTSGVLSRRVRRMASWGGQRLLVYAAALKKDPDDDG